MSYLCRCFLLAYIFWLDIAQAKTLVEKWQPTSAEKQKIAALIPDADLHFEEAYKLPYSRGSGINLLITSPHVLGLPALILMQGGTIKRTVSFDDAFRYASLKKIEAVAFRDLDKSGKIDILVIVRLKAETDAAKDSPDFFVGQTFSESAKGEYRLDAERVELDVKTIKEFESAIRKSKAKRSKQHQLMLRDYGLETGESYPDAKAHLTKSGWVIDPDDLGGNEDSKFHEITCGNGSMAICQVAFKRRKEQLCLILTGVSSCKSDYCIKSACD